MMRAMLYCTVAILIAGITTAQVTEEETTVDQFTDEPATTDGSPELPTTGILLSCTPSQMIVTIPKYLLTGGMGGSDLQFENDDSDSLGCQGVDTIDVNGTEIIRLTTDLTACGTERQESTNIDTYSNGVVNNYSDSAIIRQYSVDIPLVCTYDREHRVDLIQYQLTDYTIDKDLSEAGKYQFEFDIYEEGSFTNKYTSYPVSVGLNKPLYFAASVLSLDETMELSIRSCRATPTSIYEDETNYDFIEDACSTDPTTNITYLENEANRVGVAMNTFRFIEQGDLVYLHCDLLVCDASDPDSICKQGCVTATANPNARRRRDVRRASSSLATKRLTRGPVRVVRSADRNSISRMEDFGNDSPQQHASTAFNPWMVAMVAMATVAVVMAAMMAVIVRRVNKLSSNRRECLQEESVHLLTAE